jgi:hypothetical protein
MFYIIHYLALALIVFLLLMLLKKNILEYLNFFISREDLIIFLSIFSLILILFLSILLYFFNITILKFSNVKFWIIAFCIAFTMYRLRLVVNTARKLISVYLRPSEKSYYDNNHYDYYTPIEKEELHLTDTLKKDKIFFSVSIVLSFLLTMHFHIC